jgi:hypothetical protein
LGPIASHPTPRRMSASLIGRFGSSAFRLSTTAVSMSLAGSRFSPESAPGPFHHVIRGRGGTIYSAALPSVGWQVQADMKTHLIHRPAREIFPPQGGARAERAGSNYQKRLRADACSTTKFELVINLKRICGSAARVAIAFRPMSQMPVCCRRVCQDSQRSRI